MAWNLSWKMFGMILALLVLTVVVALIVIFFKDEISLFFCEKSADSAQFLYKLVGLRPARTICKSTVPGLL